MTRSADPAPNPGLEITPDVPLAELSPDLSWRLPAALLYLGGPDVQSRDWESLAGRLEELLPGLRRAAPGILACTVSETIANTLDTTLEFGLRLLHLEQDPRLPTLARMVLLVAPGFVESHQERWRLDDRDPLIKALAQRPTLDLAPGLYVTSRAVHALEGHWTTRPAGSWSTPSLSEVPLQQVSRGTAPGRPQVRNPRIFGRRIEWVPRRQSERALSEALATGRVRVFGPLGSGKSRLISEVLSQPRNQAIVTVTPSRSHAPLQERLAIALEQVLEGLFPSLIAADKSSVESTPDFIARLQDFAQQHPLCIVGDDLQRCTAADLAFLEKLLELPVEPDRLTLLLAGRSSTPWGPRAGSLLGVEVPMLSTDATFVHASRVCEGLEMPQDVVDRFSQSAGGSPFCFEEGILELIHRRALRRVYGSFFFGAPNDIDLTPSSRFVGHLLEESQRSETTLGLVTLASRGGPVPVDTLDRVTAHLATSPPPGWTERPPVSDCVHPVETPWGPGIDFAASSLRGAFDSLLAPAARKRVRAALGADLGPRPSTTPEARWLAYELMAGSPGAIEVLLQTLRPLPPTERRDTVFAAVCHELAELRRRRGSEEDEVRLLWALLPLARRMGRLRDIRPELDRARVLCRDNPEKLLAILTLLAEMDVDDGRPREAERFLRQAIEIAIASAPRRKSILAVELGRLLQREGRFEEARSLLERLLGEMTSPDSPHHSIALAATCRFYLANTALSQRRFRDALELHHQAYLDRREHELDNALGASLCAMGATQRALGDYRQALDYFELAYEHLGKHGRDGEISFALMGIASIRSRLGQLTLATPLLRDAVELRATHEGSVGEALSRLALAENLLDLAHHGTAALDEARRAHFRLTLVDNSPHLGLAERILGRIHLRQQNAPTARQHFQRALELHRKLHHEPEMARDLSWMLIEAQERRSREDVEQLVQQLIELREKVLQVDRGELLDYRIYDALQWLEGRGSAPPQPPVQFLRRAYRELLKRTGDLDQEQRSTYLQQVAEHQGIVRAATQHQLSLPDIA